jgi:hypothetical protein
METWQRRPTNPERFASLEIDAVVAKRRSLASVSIALPALGLEITL